MNLQKQLCCVYLHAFSSTLRFTDAVWVALLAARGFSLAQIGLFEGIFHLTSLVCEVPSGMAADLLGRRRTLIFGGVLGIFSALVMAFAPSFALICLAMALKALGYNLLSGTTEALTYDSLKSVGRERDYIKVDAKASVYMKFAAALGSLASLLAGVLTTAGYYLADAAAGLVSVFAAANLTEPVVTAEQAARNRHALQKLPARLRVHISDSIACLRGSVLARRIIAADAVISLPGYLTSMFVQQRLTELGLPMQVLFLPGLLAGAAGMAGTALGRRLHPKRLRGLYFACALLIGTGTLLAGAAPAWGCAAGPMLVQGAFSVWFLHSMQRLNDAISSDRRATLISVDSMAYSLLMIPASPLIGQLGDLTGQAGAGLCVLGAAVALSGLAVAVKTRYNGRGA
ncbi:MFS transporter [Gemmiger sp.]